MLNRKTDLVKKSDNQLKKIQAELSKIRALTNSGQRKSALHTIAALKKKGLPRKFATAVAEEARLAMYYNEGLRIIHPFIKKGTATPDERLTYARLLVDCGAYREATRILENVPSQDNPEVILLQSIMTMRNWEWANCIESLEELHTTMPLGPHASHRCARFLAAAHMHGGGNLQRAKDLLSELLLRDGGFKGSSEYDFLDAAQLAVQLAIKMGDWDLARAGLKELRDRSAGTHNPDSAIQARLLTTLLKTRSQGPSPQDLREFELIRDDFMRAGLFFRARYCDYVRARAMLDLPALDAKPLFTHLYFGTPCDRFRELTLPRLSEVPPFYDLKIASKTGKTEKTEKNDKDHETAPSFLINLETGVFKSLQSENGFEAEIEKGNAKLRLFTALCADFYRPPSWVQLFEALYPNDDYNPTSSPAKLDRLLGRLKMWLKTHKIPLEITEADGNFSLVAKETCIIRVPSPHQQDLSMRLGKARLVKILDTLRGGGVPEEFSAAEVSEKLKMPYISAIRYINAAVAEGKLARIKMGRNIRYRMN